MKSINHKAGEKQDIQTWNQKLSLNYKQGLKSAQAIRNYEIIQHYFQSFGNVLLKNAV